MSHKCFLLFAGFFFLVSNLSIGQNIDINLLRDINLNRNESFDGVFKLLTNTAAPISAGIPVGMLGVSLIKGDSALTRHAEMGLQR